MTAAAAAAHPAGAAPLALRARHTGRFAPSPTGQLHLGSLVAAVASFLDARHHAGRWLVRMEDLDTLRVVPGSAAEILRTLEAFGLEWDGEVEYQSRRTELYDRALETLASRGLTFPCSCSRREAQSAERPATMAGPEPPGKAIDAAPYPGTCRNGPARPGPTALRFRIDDEASIGFEDRIQGRCEYALRTLGDVVVRRRDGVHAYQLAVTVDDAAQAVTSVVRGADLLPSTAWQIALCEALGLPALSYAHVPLVVEPDGAKLAKSRHSVPLDPLDAGAWIFKALRLLRQDPPDELAREPAPSALRWGADHWSLARLARIRAVPAHPG